MSKRDKYKNTFTMDQIKTMPNSDLYSYISRYRSLIEDLRRKDDDSVQLEREFCYLERERLVREKNKPFSR